MDWKIAVTMVVVVGILVGAFLATGPGTGVTGYFTGLIPVPATNMSVSASLAPQDINLDASADSLLVSWTGADVQWTVGSSKLDLSGKQSNEIKLDGWKGRIKASGGVLSLDGSTTRLIVNGVAISQSGRQVVKVSDMKPDKFAASGLILRGLKLNAASGTITVGDGKASFRADGEPLELGTFTGSLELDPMLKLSGTTDKLLLAGKSKLSASQ